MARNPFQVKATLADALPEGISEAPPAVEAPRVVDRPRLLTVALAGSDESIFYSTAAIRKFIGVPFDIEEQFFSESNIDRCTKVVVCTPPLFAGLDQKENALLTMMPKEHFERFLRWLLCQAFKVGPIIWRLRARKIITRAVDFYVFLPYVDDGHKIETSETEDGACCFWVQTGVNKKDG